MSDCIENHSVKLKAIDANDLKNIIQSRKDKTIVVNVWATWCKPCVKEFPELMELKDDYADKNVDVIFISVDALADSLKRVIPFLCERNLTEDVFQVKSKETKEFMAGLSKDWMGFIPVTMIYDKNKNLVKFIERQTSYDEIEKIIKPLL